MSTKKPLPEGVAESKFSPKQARFVDEYLIDLNATQAAIRAGYSKKTATEMGYENLTKPHVASAIQAKQKELAHAAGITREKVIDEMAKLAFSDLRVLFRPDGTVKPVDEWPEGIAGAVASLKVVETLRAETDEAGNLTYKPEYTKELRLWDKGKQLENLLKHLGMEKPRSQADVPQSIDPLLAKLDRLLPQEAAA